MSRNGDVVRVLFVCLGNICRSPTAEGVFRHLLEREGILGKVETDSAGTAGYHVGEPPDGRSQRTAARRGYDLSMLRSRKVEARDFSRFDYLLAMDDSNRSDLLAAAPAGSESRVRMFLEFAPGVTRREVPDPYSGGPSGFEDVLDLVEEAGEGLLDFLRREHGFGAPGD